MSNVLIVGYGVVGRNLSEEYKKLNPDICDKYKEGCSTKKAINYDVAFICVDTPKTDKSVCDVSEIYNAIHENEADIYVIKSTVLPGTTETIARTTGKTVLFSPEYYGGTQHCNNFEFDFTILGGDKTACRKVVQILQNVYDGRHKFVMTDPTTAEIAKYMENSYLATKVSFCNEFAKIARNHHVSYEEVRELFVLDPRVNPSHTFVYEEHPYWESHCLDKDVPAIAEAEGAELLKAVCKYNETTKNNVLFQNN